MTNAMRYCDATLRVYGVYVAWKRHAQSTSPNPQWNSGGPGRILAQMNDLESFFDPSRDQFLLTESIPFFRHVMSP